MTTETNDPEIEQFELEDPVFKALRGQTGAVLQQNGQPPAGQPGNPKLRAGFKDLLGGKGPGGLF